MEKHVKLLGILFIVYHVLGLLFGFFLLSLLSAIGVLSRDPEVAGIWALVGLVGSSFLLVLSLPGVIAGIGLLKHKPWARILALVIAFLAILQFPVGTVLAGYAFWVLLKDETDRLFRAAPAGPAPAG